MSFHRPIQIGVLLIALVVSGSVAQAQEQGQQGPTNQPMGHEMSNDQMQRMHQQIVPGSQTSDTTTPTMPGQDAFGAIQEIVRILEADPKTDWSKVNLEALRQHLIDMKDVTLKADAAAKPIDGGVEIAVTGTERTIKAIQRDLSPCSRNRPGPSQWLERQDCSPAERRVAYSHIERPSTGAAHPRPRFHRITRERIASSAASSGNGQGRVHAFQLIYRMSAYGTKPTFALVAIESASDPKRKSRIGN